MTDRKRLTIRKGNKTYINSDTIPRKNCGGKYGFHFCKYATKCRSIVDRKCPVLRILDKLAYYEDLEEQGKLIIPPCKVGDTTYLLLEKDNSAYDIIKSKCVSIFENERIKSYSMWFDCKAIGNTLEFYHEDFGKTVFFTKEDAEAKLKELNGQ